MANTKITSNVISDDIALGGNPTTTTQSAGNNTTRIATTAFVKAAIDATIDSAPGALDTLNELAAAIGDDANFSTTITNSIATKLPLAGGTMSGALNMGGQNISNAGDISGGILTAETSSDYPLRVKSTDGFSGIVLQDNSSTTNGNVIAVTGDTMDFYTGGTSSSTDIALSLASNNNATFHGDIIANKNLRLYTTDDQAQQWYLYTHTDDNFRINYNGAGNDALVIDTSENFTFNGAGTIDSGSQYPTLTLKRSSTASGLSYTLGLSDFTGGGTDLIFDGVGASTGFGFRPRNSSGNQQNGLIISPDGKVGVGLVSPYFPLHVQGANLSNGSAKSTALLFDTTSATTGTGGGLALGGYSNGTGGDIYHFGNIQGIKENSTAGDYASAMTFATRANGATPTEKMRILSTGQITTGGLTSTTGHLHLYQDAAHSGKLVLQSQVAANAKADITFMSRNASNTNKNAVIELDGDKEEINLKPATVTNFSVSRYGSTLYGNTNTNQGIGQFIGSVAPHNVGNRYIHVQLSTNYNQMAHIFVHGYSYTSALIEGACSFYFYNNANQTTLYDGRYSGSIVAGHCNSSNNYAEIVIDTLGTNTTNRWGSISIYGGQDNIISYHHTRVVQVSHTNSTARAFT